MAGQYRYTYEAEMMKVANFRANDRDTLYVPHLISLKLGGKDLEKDFSFKDPMAPAVEVPMAAVMTSFQWTGEEGKPIDIVGRVTDKNHSILHGILEDNDKTREVELVFNIYRHQTGEKFFKTLHTDGAPIKGTIILDQCYVNDRAMTDYTQIRNYEFRLVIEGARGAPQAIQSDRGADMKKAVQFGNPSPIA